MKEREATQSQYWWIKKGYHAFEPSKDGFPCPGQVVKHYRRLKMNDKGKRWTQKDLAKVLGVSEQAIRDLENRDAGMDSYNRRRFLADLFNIPYILLGIVSLDEILKQQAEQKRAEDTHAAVIMRKSIFVDAQEYQDRLLSYWSVNHTDPAQGVIRDSLESLDALYRALPHVHEQEKHLITELACGYHQFIANILFRNNSEVARLKYLLLSK